MATDLLGTRQEMWVRRPTTEATSALSAFGAYGHLTAAPSDDPTAGKYVIQLPNHDSSGATSCSFALMFFAIPGSTSNKPKVLARVWGLSGYPSVNDLTGQYLADLEATIGSSNGGGGMFGSGQYFAARIRDLDDRTLTPPAVRFVANEPASEVAPAGIAMAAFLNVGFKTMVVELRRSGGQSGDDVGLCWRVF